MLKQIEQKMFDLSFDMTSNRFRCRKFGIGLAPETERPGVAWTIEHDLDATLRA